MRRTRGFVLVELMVVVLIVAILAAIAYPGYQRYIIRGKRAQAQAALFQLMQQQERYYTQNNRYLAFSSASTEADEQLFKWWSGTVAAHSAYELSGAACEGEPLSRCLMLVARPGTDKVDRNYRDVDCAELGLSSTGLRWASGLATDCWP